MYQTMYNKPVRLCVTDLEKLNSTGGPVCVWPDVSEVILVAICMQLLLIIYKVQ